MVPAKNTKSPAHWTAATGPCTRTEMRAAAILKTPASWEKVFIRPFSPRMVALLLYFVVSDYTQGAMFHIWNADRGLVQTSGPVVTYLLLRRWGIHTSGTTELIGCAGQAVEQTFVCMIYPICMVIFHSFEKGPCIYMYKLNIHCTILPDWWRDKGSICTCWFIPSS